ncbi:unnamed protein product [Anisakis simplex]|uniref:Hypoxia-inducible factor 1 (inferred by orthology to a C. elegans protein) n=1 Tax=Anisakis simplex TaxID=6269 RepID=A0A0M3JGK6_ANISI|nr:unnamed protein product [Anisakis simplex]
MGTSFYNLVHPADIEAVAASMRELLSKGHTKTPYYRLIGAAKTVLWVQTEATTVNHTSKGHKGQYVICIHELLGYVPSLEVNSSYFHKKFKYCRCHIDKALLDLTAVRFLSVLESDFIPNKFKFRLNGVIYVCVFIMNFA